MGITLELRPEVAAETSVEEIQASMVYQEWAGHFNPNQEITVTVNEANIWAEHGEAPEVHGLQINYQTVGMPWKHRLALRTPTVDVLTAFSHAGDDRIALVEEFRPAIGSRILANPAGGKKWNESPEQAAGKEIWQELGLRDYTAMDLGQYLNLERMRAEPREVSPGITNERTWFFMAQFAMPSAEALADVVAFLQGKHTGVAEDGEFITVHVVPRPHVREWISSHPPIDMKMELSFSYAGV